ncbi:DUF2958 domain-containing protein [Oscillatoria amoena NRMC-F 0135]|nr:DUF2958 domain-containing protein [Oscillatoria amoena NRMC-F 0135]
MTRKNTLITKTLAAQFARIGDQRDVKDPILVAKFFNPTGIGTWYAIAYYPEDNTCFGFVSHFEDELGYFSIKELESLRVPPFDLAIERDLYFTPCRLSEVKAKKP